MGTGGLSEKCPFETWAVSPTYHEGTRGDPGCCCGQGPPELQPWEEAFVTCGFFLMQDVL